MASLRPDGPAARFASGLPFSLDPFQLHALEAVEGGESVLVAAPTGAGKTVVAEFACWLALHSGAKCFYTTPLKALSNQKFGDLVARHGAPAVGLLTGDNTINGEAPLVVMTTEVLRNMLYEGSPTLTGLRWVVLDEVHYLQDPYRGAVWEEVLIHLPEKVRVICLSATVSNAEELGDWIRTIRGPTRVIVTQHRPVELRNLVMVGEELYPLFREGDGGRELNPELVRAWAKGTAAAVRHGHHARRRRHAEAIYVPTRVEVAEVLQRERMLPAIYFIFSRDGCDRAVQACIYADLRLSTGTEGERAVEYAELRSASVESEDLRALGFGTFLEGLRRGVAAHHAGLLPVFKETVEELFAMGLVKLVFATETLSLGINMPAKTVVIERLTKFTGDRHELLTPMDYTQLTGRAGRRGIDTLGYGVVLYNPLVGLDRVATLATVRRYPLSSSFRPSYNMAVNLVARYERETAIRLLGSSFASYQADREVVRAERQAEALEREAAGLRERASCDRGDFEEYWRLREASAAERARRRGGAEVVQAFARLVPGDVIVGERLGRALVLEQPRPGRSEPQLTVMTPDRKVRRLSPRDFTRPPVAVARMALRGQSWRSPKVRRDLVRGLQAVKAAPPPPEPPPPHGDHRAHPCHACPEREAHARAREQLAKVEAQLAEVRRRVRLRRQSIVRTFDRVLAVLGRLGYVSDWALTPKGETLARVYNEADLLVVECLQRGWLAGLDPEELAAVVSLFVYEARGRERSEGRGAPTPHLSRCARRILDLYRSLHEIELGEGLELLKEPDTGFMAPIHDWARGCSLEEVLESYELSAGDFVRWAKQVVDLLQQLRQVTEGTPLEEELAAALRAVQRGVVAYSGVL